MYPGGSWMAGEWLPAFNFGMSVPDGGMTSGYWPGYTYWTDFLFQETVLVLFVKELS